MSYPGKKPTDDDEVEQLLRAAHDDMLLKLSVDSHMARATASAAIDPDLDRRYQALRNPLKHKIINDPKRTPPDAGDNKTVGAAEDDDLFARFAALKNTIPSLSGKENKSDSPSDVSFDHQAEEEEDEVEKLIKWAIDAARLDPSPPSDEDDDDDDEDEGDRGGKTSTRK